ncbi:MAG TPA: hypothetical protein VLZ81_09845 [Blastocatellia bacterium]|nr:hypothetical protein [Blastocatellia bacterium]
MDKAPLSVQLAILAGFDKRASDAYLRADEMPPLIPSRIPADREKGAINVNLRFAPAIPIQRIFIQVLDSAQRGAELALMLVRQIGQNPPSKEGLPIRCQFAGGDALSETAVCEERRGVRVLKEGVVASAELGVGQEIECPLSSLQVKSACFGSLKLNSAEPIGQSQVRRRRLSCDLQDVVKRWFAGPLAEGIKVVAHGCVREVQGANAEGTLRDLRTNEEVTSLVGFWLRGVPDPGEVKLLRIVAAAGWYS